MHRRSYNVVRLAVYLFLKKGRSILLIRRFNTGYMDGWYTTVAGHIEKDETAVKTAIREAREEVGIRILEKDLKLAHIQHRYRRAPGDSDYVDFHFIATRWRGEPRNMEPNKCDDIGWFDIGRLPKKTLPYILLILKRIKEGRFYSEYGF